VLVIAWTFMKHGTSVETLKNSLSELEERSVQKNVEAGVAAAPQEAPAIKTEAEADAPPQPTQ
jgi:hypothetical protein